MNNFKMKNSGIEWIGEIPDEWTVGALKYFYSMQTGFTPSTQNDNYYDDESGMIWVTISDITNAGKYIYDSKSKISKKYLTDYTPKITPSNSLLYSFKLSIGTVAFAGVPLYTNEAIASFIKTEKVNLDFLYYSSFLILYNANTNIYGAKLLNQDLIRNAKIIFPPLSTQQKIADYLDKKCAAVDRLIENQQAQIEKLKEYKQSVITEAVTRGLDSSAPIKDSGVEWIGNICERFELRRLKEVAQILDEYRKPITADLRNQDAEILYDYYGASGVIDKIDGYTIDDHVMLIGEDGANLKMRNLPLMYEVNGKAWINNHAHILKPYLNMDFYYLFYCLESLDINPYITGSAQPKLSQENLKNIQLPVPPLEEQQKIADYLDKKCAEIDKLISIKQQKIETLTEYKKSLIYEYVTGKKEVVS